jgi:hypothetical protein
MGRAPYSRSEVRFESHPVLRASTSCKVDCTHIGQSIGGCKRDYNQFRRRARCT